MGIETLGFAATVLAVAGVVLNNRKYIACFYFWLVSNWLSAMVHWQSGIYSLLVRDAIFMLLALEGIYQWRRRNT